MGFYSTSEEHEKAWKEKVANKDSFAINLVRDIKKSIEELENLPGDWENNTEIQASLLEIQTKLTDCIVDIQDSWEMTEGYYRYNEKEQKPEYVIWMNKCMEDKLLERIKDDPVFKFEIESIQEDKDYPDTKRNHIATILSTLVFNYILDGAVGKAVTQGQEEKKKEESVQATSVSGTFNLPDMNLVTPDMDLVTPEYESYLYDITTGKPSEIAIDYNSDSGLFSIKNNQTP